MGPKFGQFTILSSLISQLYLIWMTHHIFLRMMTSGIWIMKVNACPVSKYYCSSFLSSKTIKPETVCITSYIFTINLFILRRFERTVDPVPKKTLWRRVWWRQQANYGYGVTKTNPTRCHSRALSRHTGDGISVRVKRGTDHVMGKQGAVQEPETYTSCPE